MVRRRDADAAPSSSEMLRSPAESPQLGGQTATAQKRSADEVPAPGRAWPRTHARCRGCEGTARSHLQLKQLKTGTV